MGMLLKSLLLFLLGEFTIYTVEGEKIRAESLRFVNSEDGGQVSVGRDKGLPVSKISYIENNGSISVDLPGISIWFRNGMKANCDRVGFDGSTLRLYSSIYGSVSTGNKGIERIIFTTNYREKHDGSENIDTEYEDVLVRSNGDISKGVLLSVDEDEVRFKSNILGELRLGHDEVSHIRLVSVDGEGEDLSGKWKLFLSDGSKLIGDLVYISDTTVKVSIFGETVVQIPIKNVISLTYENPDFKYLSDMEPAEVVVQPHAIEGLPELKRDYQRDRSARKTILSIDGRKFSKGIGVRARTVLKYDIGGDYEFFYSTIGIDDCVDPLARKYADVRFRVYGDERLLYESKVKKFGDEPEEIKVAVSNINQLVLEVDFGDIPEVGDWADWASARIVK